MHERFSPCLGFNELLHDQLHLKAFVSFIPNQNLTGLAQAYSQSL